MKTKIAYFVLGFAVGLAVSTFMYDGNPDTELKIMSQAQMQELLNALEPDRPVKVDGVIGKTSREKWSSVYGQQSADDSYSRMARIKSRDE